MGNPWFRLYHEFADDPKVQMLPEAMQRRFIMLLCSKCKGETLQETQMAFHWRISLSELAETKALFIENGFIEEDWSLCNWNKRQFLSDSSTDRVRRFRQAKKHDETLHETNETVTVTAPDTEQIQKQSQKHKHLAVTAIALPAERGRLLGTILLNQGEYEVRQDDLARDGPLYPGIDVVAEYRAMKAWSLANPTKRKTRKGMARFMNQWLSKAQDNLKGSSHGGFQTKADRDQSEYERVLKEIADSESSEDVRFASAVDVGRGGAEAVRLGLGDVPDTACRNGAEPHRQPTDGPVRQAYATNPEHHR